MQHALAGQLLTAGPGPGELPAGQDAGDVEACRPDSAEADVDPDGGHRGSCRDGAGIVDGAPQGAVAVRPAAGDVADGGRRGEDAGEEVAVGAAGDQDGNRVQGQVGGADLQGELRGGIEQAGRVDPGGVEVGEGDVDVAASVEDSRVEDLTLDGVCEGGGRGGEGDELGLGHVAAATEVGEAAGDEADGVPTGREGGGEAVPVGVARPDPDGRSQCDQGALGIPELDLAAVDRGGVDAVAAGATEDDLEVVQRVEDVSADRLARDRGICGGTDDGEAVGQGRAERWREPGVVGEGVQLDRDGDDPDAERAGEQVAVGGAVEPQWRAAQERRRSQSGAGQGDLIAVDGGQVQQRPRAGAEGHVEVARRGGVERDRDGGDGAGGAGVHGLRGLAGRGGERHADRTGDGAGHGDREGVGSVAEGRDRAAGVQGHHDAAGGVELDAGSGRIHVQVHQHVEDGRGVEAGGQGDDQLGLSAGEGGLADGDPRTAGDHERPRANGRRDRDGAGGGEEAGHPVAEGDAAVGIAGDQDRRPAGVQRDRAEARPAEGELGAEVQQRGQVEGASGGRGERDVEPGVPAATVDHVDVHRGARCRVGHGGADAGDGEGLVERRAAGPRGGDSVHGDVGVLDRVGGEAELHHTEAQRGAEGVAETRDPCHPDGLGEQVAGQVGGREFGGGQDGDRRGRPGVEVGVRDLGAVGDQRDEQDAGGRGHRHQRHRRPAGQRQRGAVERDRELVTGVQDGRQVEGRAVGGGEDHVDRRAGGATVDRAAVACRSAEADRGSRAGRGRVRSVHDAEADVVAAGILEAHLELAVDAQQPDLVGNVG